MSSEPVLRVAAKAVIFNEQGEVLILRESGSYIEGTNQGRYGVPGGRLEPGESFFEGLRREAMEEADLEVEPLQPPLYVGEWRPVINGIEHHIVAMYMPCRAKADEVVLSEDHDHFVWVKPSEHGKYDIMSPEGEVIDEFGRWFANHA